MSKQDEKTGDLNIELPEGCPKVDRRYRESRYFLMDQLQYAESVRDFRSIKQAIARSNNFDLPGQAFQFARITTDSC